MAKEGAVAAKTLARLCLYRRILTALHAEGVPSIYSHQLAEQAGATAAQVRRDLMATGYSGTPSRGYGVQELIASLGRFLDAPEGQGVALVGIGNLGRALLAYFTHRRPKLWIAAAFDTDPQKTGRVIHGCRCFALTELADIVAEHRLRLGVVAVPAASAQAVADQLIQAGILGLLNFAPIRLRVPKQIYVEDIDLTMSLETVAFFAHRQAQMEEDGS